MKGEKKKKKRMKQKFAYFMNITDYSCYGQNTDPIATKRKKKKTKIYLIQDCQIQKDFRVSQFKQSPRKYRRQALAAKMRYMCCIGL